MPTASKGINPLISFPDMKNTREQINVLFHNRAGEAMLSLFREFKHSVAAIDRQWEENVFQQQQGRYTALLKHRLDSIALELLSLLDTGDDRNEWSHMAGGFVRGYLHEFGQKIRAM